MYVCKPIIKDKLCSGRGTYQVSGPMKLGGVVEMHTEMSFVTCTAVSVVICVFES